MAQKPLNKNAALRLAEQGLAQRRAGRAEEAVAALQEAVRAGGPPWARAVLGETLRELGARRRGYGEIQAALGADPLARFARGFLDAPQRCDAWALACRGGSARRRDLLEPAESDFRAALALDPGCGWAWGWLGELQLRAGRLEAALESLHRAVGLFPEWAEAFHWRGETFRQSARDEESLRDLDHAVALGLRRYDLFLSRAAARQSLGDAKGHLEDLARAVRADPELFRAQARASGDKTAGAWIDAELKRARASARQLESARAELEAGRPEGARARLSALLAADPNNAGARLALAEALTRLGRGEAAVSEADAAVRADPCADTYSKRAEIAQRAGYMESALRDLSLALALAPSAALYHWRARTFLGMRHYGLAVSDLGEAIELEPDSPELYDVKAHLSLLLGKTSSAREAIERAVRLMPAELPLRLRLAQILALQGKLGEARAEAAAVSKRSKAWGSFVRGYILCLEKRYPEAAEQFEAARRGAGKDESLARQAGFFGTIAKAFKGLPREETMAGKKTAARAVRDKGKVYLCGLGVYPPQTATIEVLRGISECDVIFNNLPGLGISEFLGLFCANRRPVAFRYEQDAKLCADLVLSELKPGRTVGFVTFGHPLLFGPLSHEIIKRCAKEGIPCKAFGAVSSMDAVLAASGQVLGFSYPGFQVFETTGAGVLREISAVNPRLPVVVYFAEGLGDQGLRSLIELLRGVYSPDHQCLLYGPKHELWETEREAMSLTELAKTSHHKLAQGILFVPPKS